MTTTTEDDLELDALVARVEGALQEPPRPAHERDVALLAGRLAAIDANASAPRRALATRGALAAGRQCYRMGHLIECASHLRNAAVHARGLDDLTRLEVLLQLAEYELLACDVGKALGCTLEAMEIASRTGDPAHEARVLTQLGGVLQSAGLHRQADHCWAQALERLGDRLEPRARGNLWALRFPTGFLLDERGDAVALEAFRQALASAEAAGPRFRDSMAANAHCNRAAALVQQGRLDEARSHLAQAADCRNVSDRLRWMVSAFYAMAEVREHNDADRRARLERLLHPDRAPARIYLVETYGILAAMFAAMGDATLAGAYLARLSDERAATLADLLAAFNREHPADGADPGREETALAFLEHLAITAELRDDATGRHCYRMARLARHLGARAGLPEGDLAAFEIAARLHDVGKLVVPDSILLKPGRLDDMERHLMRSHVHLGERIVAAGRVEVAAPVARIVRHHHERWDGTGYPDRLAGEAIPIEARIAALADVYDALTHERPYKRAWSHEEAMGYLRAERGGHFDPVLVDHFEAMLDDASATGVDFRTDLEKAADASPFQAVLAKLPEAWQASL
ncbi:MAG: HD-GYP domain-containing protein [Betaproteobacteria bacterium]|nr:HD-GYP domain-containing protein [Betaproteobacteria bacterium]